MLTKQSVYNISSKLHLEIKISCVLLVPSVYSFQKEFEINARAFFLQCYWKLIFNYIIRLRYLFRFMNFLIFQWTDSLSNFINLTFPCIAASKSCNFRIELSIDIGYLADHRLLCDDTLKFIAWITEVSIINRILLAASNDRCIPGILHLVKLCSVT